MLGVVRYVPCRFSDRLRVVRHAVVKTDQVWAEIMYESPARFECAHVRFEAESTQLRCSQRARTEATAVLAAWHILLRRFFLNSELG
jgi:hypothetical protein